VLFAPLALTACDSTAEQSARRAQAAPKLDRQAGLRVGRENREIRVGRTVVLNDRRNDRTAAVVTLRNTGPRTQLQVPLAITVTDRRGKVVFRNDLPGLTADLTSAPVVEAGDQLAWVNDQIVNARGARRVRARVGESPRRAAGAAAAAAPLPRITLRRVRLRRDAIEQAYTATGRVVNRSRIVQRRLVVFGVARRRGRIVAAGRAVIPTLNPGAKGVAFTIFFVGNPKGAELDLTAPPVVVQGGR